MSEFLKRLFTGIVFTAIMIYTTQNYLFLLIILILIATMSMYELYKMVYFLQHGKLLFISGCLYIFIALISWHDLSKRNIFQINAAFIVMILTWCNDVMAYLTGKAFGKTKIIPSISPGKTWEGTIAGVFSTCFISLTIQHFTLGDRYYISLLLGICTGIFATLGDLIESKVKRMAGMKDSGNMLPGHGGVLDRLDAMFLTMPMAWLLIYFL